MSTTTSWISKQPNRCGGDACIRDTRITVWGLAAYKRLGMPDDAILHAIQGLTQEDLDAAWEYAGRNQEEIEVAIRRNEAGSEGFVE